MSTVRSTVRLPVANLYSLHLHYIQLTVLDDLHGATLANIIADFSRTLQFLVLKASHVVTMSKAGFLGPTHDYARQKMDETVNRFRERLRVPNGHNASSSRNAASASGSSAAPEKPM